MGAISDYVYVMRVESMWMVRLPRRVVASQHTELADAMEEAEEFAQARRCMGGAPVLIRVRRPEGVWVELDAEGGLHTLAQ
jgi:hypothetical protein